MYEKAEGKDDATEHPHIHLFVDLVPQKRIRHFGWPVHQRGPALILLLVRYKVILINQTSRNMEGTLLPEVNALSAARPEVAQFELAVLQKYILDLYITVGHWRIQLVHGL